MDLTIKPGAATDDAVQIDQIVAQIRSDMETLDAAMKRNIPNGIQTTWSERVSDNWNSYYNADLHTGMEEMETSATNLRLAVQASLKYDEEH